MARATAVPLVRVERDWARADHDLVAAEAPLNVELRTQASDRISPLGVLMRTPGDDRDLITGWLFTERVIRDPAEILDVAFMTGDPVDSAGQPHEPESAPAASASVVVTLAASVALEQIVGRRVLTPTSACGLCGRLAIDRLDARAAAGPVPRGPWPAALISTLPGALLAAQTAFAETGGLHAAGLSDDDGRLHLVREDVGRHNAVDKVIGAALSGFGPDWPCRILVVSGRVAFEIVQKAAVAGLAAIVAVGAPSDLAIRAARETQLTLVGFARAGRFNVYAGAERIAPPPARDPGIAPE